MDQEEKLVADYEITCCSTADLSIERLRERNIKWVPFHFHMDGKDYYDDYGQSMSLQEFYQRERDGATPTTSQVNTDEYLKFWKPILEEGHDILHIALSSGISGTYNSASVAAEDARESYPDRKIYIVDSLCASAGYGLLMEELCDRKDAGMGIEELRDLAENMKMSVNHWVFTSDLTSLIRGGRVSAAAGTVANILSICPVIEVDAEGKLTVVSKVRTKKKVILEIVKKMETLATGGTAYDGRCYISYSDCQDDAAALREKIEERFPAEKGKVETFRIGTTIGAHTGVATVALFFLGKERTL